jgi:hypothetical protein
MAKLRAAGLAREFPNNGNSLVENPQLATLKVMQSSAPRLARGAARWVVAPGESINQLLEEVFGPRLEALVSRYHAD